MLRHHLISIFVIASCYSAAKEKLSSISDTLVIYKTFPNFKIYRNNLNNYIYIIHEDNNFIDSLAVENLVDIISIDFNSDSNNDIKCIYYSNFASESILYLQNKSGIDKIKLDAISNNIYNIDTSHYYFSIFRYPNGDLESNLFYIDTVKIKKDSVFLESKNIDTNILSDSIYFIDYWHKYLREKN